MVHEKSSFFLPFTVVALWLNTPPSRALPAAQKQAFDIEKRRSTWALSTLQCSASYPLGYQTYEALQKRPNAPGTRGDPGHDSRTVPEVPFYRHQTFPHKHGREKETETDRERQTERERTTEKQNLPCGIDCTASTLRRR